MASTDSLTAFNFWLDQDRKGRTSSALAKSLDIPFETAKKWVTMFNKRLTAEIERSTAIKLKTYVAEFEKVQRLATESTVALAELYASEANELRASAQMGEKPDLDELNKITSGIKSVYQLAEAASGADVAKSRAKIQTSQDVNQGLPALPDMTGIYEVAGEDVSADEGEIETDTEEKEVSK